VYGGTLAAGPREVGGYRVSATLPLDPDEAAEREAGAAVAAAWEPAAIGARIGPTA
jgi:hypothetical protein